jgi:hypothetical protein
MEIVTGLTVASAFQATRRTRALRRELKGSSTAWAVDRHTGLLRVESFVERLRGERSRAIRFGTSLHLWLALAVDGSALDFGHLLAGELRFPAFGSRLNGYGLYCIVLPDGDPEEVRAVLRECCRNQSVVIGETFCPNVESDIETWLAEAEADLQNRARGIAGVAA